jgi:hypothetical protein
MRIHLFEFEDLPWFPGVIREGGTDYLRYLLNALGFYKPTIPLIAELVNKTGNSQIIDLCSGGGGAIEQIATGLSEYSQGKISITLSDKFPNAKAYSYLKERSNGTISFIDQSVDATNVPKEIKGFRTMFSAVHHFSPDTIKAVLKNSVDSNTGIALFDGGDKNIFTFFGIFILHPIVFVLCTPFFKPFRFSRIFFTYIIPLIPLMTIWDGAVSILRLYSPEELLKIAKQIDAAHYTWEAGKLKSGFGMHVTYLTGYPTGQKANDFQRNKEKDQKI